MRLGPSLWLFVLGAVLLGALCLLLQTSMAVRSSDLALHYSLVDYFTRSWSLPPQLVNPVMAGYAPIAHMLGGAAGRLIGSGFLAMHFASLGFVFLIYVFVFLGLERPSLLSTSLSYALLFLAIAALHSTFALHGYEIVGNFFFAQIAGEAAFLAALFVLSGGKRDKREIVLLPLLVFLFGWLFPLAQIKLAVGALVLWLVDLFGDWRATKTFDWRRAGLIVLLGVLCVAAIVLHPTFGHFRWIAEHNGKTKQTLSVFAIAGCAGLLLLASLALSGLALWRKLGLLRPFFIATVGLATVIPFFGQAILHFGFGVASEYAVRKHAYAIMTLLAASAIALLVEAAQRLMPLLSRLRLPAVLSGGGMAMAGAFLVTLILVSHYAEDRTAFLAYQREVRANPQLKGKTLSLNRDHPGEFNLAISMVDLDLPGELYPFVPVVLGRSQPKGQVRVLPRFALISPTAEVAPNCLRREAALASAKLVEYGCK